MSWNHRIVRRVFNGPTGPEEFLSVHEVYYDDADRPNGITSNACAPGGETLDELRMELARMLAATGQPILEYDEVARPQSIKYGTVEVKDEELAPEATRRMVSEKELNEMKEIKAFMKQRARMKGFTVGHGDFIQMCTVCDADDRGTPHRPWCPLYVNSSNHSKETK